MSEELRQRFWDQFADEYEKTALENTNQVYHQLLGFINLHECQNVLEVACGTGAGLEILRNLVNPSCQITASDFSPVMVQKSQSKNLENCTILQLSNQSLSLENNLFDAYIANFSLHLVPDASQMLSEALRVLKPGRSAVFSVWGKAEDTNMFVLMQKAESKCGIASNLGRSPFYLNDQENLNQLAREAGFVNVRSFYTSCPVGVRTGEEFVKMNRNAPGYSEESLGSEKYEMLIRELKNEADDVFASGRLVTFDSLVLVGEKTN